MWSLLGKFASCAALYCWTGLRVGDAVRQAVAQYEQKILGQQRRKGRFSSSSSPDVSRHASVSSSAHATPRDNVTAVQSGSAAGWVAEPQSFSSAPRASRAPHGGERAEGEGPTGAPRLPKEAPGKGAQAAWALAAGLLDSASAGRNATAATSGRYEVEQSTAAALAEVSEGAAEGLPKPGAEASVASPAVAAAVLRQGTEDGAAAEQQTEGARQDSGELPVSTAAFPGPSSEPEAPPQPPRQAQPPAAADRDRPPGAAGATVAATGATGGDEPAEINGDSGGAAEESRTDAARGSGSGGSAGRRAQERESVEMQLRCEGAREPEWVAAFRRMVSLAVNTPLPLTPTPADPPSPHGQPRSSPEIVRMWLCTTSALSNVHKHRRWSLTYWLAWTTSIVSLDQQENRLKRRLSCRARAEGWVEPCPVELTASAGAQPIVWGTGGRQLCRPAGRPSGGSRPLWQRRVPAEPEHRV